MANEAKQFTIGGVTHDVMDVGARQLISDLQTAIDALTGGDTTTAIKTFQEVIDFLDGVTDDQTLVGKLNELRTLIAAKVDKVTGKGLSTEDYTTAEKQKLAGLSNYNDTALQTAVTNLQTAIANVYTKAETYSKTEVDDKVAEAGKVKSVTINGTKHTPDAQTGDVNLGTVVGEKGEKGDTGSVVVSDGVAQIGIINDLATGGTGDALSAEMGKRLGAQVGALEDAVEEMEDGAGYDISIVGQQLVITSRNRPSVAVGEVSNHNVACKAGNTATASFYVSGRKLTSPVQIAVSDATNWQVSPASISPVDGKVALTLVTITYRPAAGTASGTTHNCNVTVTCGGVTYGTIAMQGTVAAAPSITLTPATLNIKTTSGTPATATINVKGSALEGDIALAISGTGFTLSQNTVAKADAESAAGADVTVTFDGSVAGTATITATATGAAAATTEVTGAIPTPLPVGAEFTVGSLKYKVLTSNTVNVSGVSGISGDITIPDTINDEGVTATLPDSSTQVGSGVTYNVTEVAEKGFYYSGMTSVVLGSHITKLNNKAFQGSTKMTSITLPNSLAIIGGEAFSGCSRLSGVDIPASVTAVGSMAFNGCSTITHAEIPNVSGIGTYAFNGCSGMTSLLMGNTANLPNKGLNGCTSLVDLTLTADKVITGNTAASDIFTLDSNGKVAGLTLHVPSGQVANYRASSFWSAIIDDVNTNIVAIS